VKAVIARRERSDARHARSRSKNGVASLAYVAGIRALATHASKDMDGRDKPGHNEIRNSHRRAHHIGARGQAIWAINFAPKR
jgi:hypothetical protein